MSDPADLHERSVTIAIEPVGEDGLRLHAELRDLRKVEVTSFRGAGLPPGVVHHMLLDAELDASLTIRAIDTRMETIPFERGDQTRGEGCRDILPNYQGLVGTQLDPSYALRVNELVGGPLGCFHILSLAQCLPLAVRDCVSVGRHKFRREMRIGAFADDSPHLKMTGTLRDERADGAGDALLQVALTLPRFEIADSSVRGLIGLAIAKGFTRAALDVLDASEEPRRAAHLAALVIALTPVVPQAASAFAGFHKQERRFGTERGSPQVDSCHMWRSGGPVVALVKDHELSRQPAKKV